MNRKIEKRIRKKGKKKRLCLSIFVLIMLLFVPLSAYASETKTVRVGYFPYANFQEGGYGEHKQGAGYEYLQKISYITGWKYEYVYGSFKECLDMLADGEIDILGSVSYTPERAESIDFSTYAEGTERYWIYTREDHMNLTESDLKQMNGCRIGVADGSNQKELLEKWLDSNQIQAEVVACKDYDEMIEKASKFSLEVRFLRAFYLFELAKRYGDIPLITRTYTQEDINSVRKTSFAEVVDFIAKECTEITREGGLPEDAVRGETGRVTKGAALALKSRALLYAASELHNPGHELKKWEAAAKAAYEVINMNKYQLPKIAADPLYSDLGGNEILKSKQLIFERRATATTSDFESRNEPMGYEGAEGGNTPTQNLVDAYEMKDGTPFDWNNSTHVASMYYDAANKQTRDPRLYLNVLTNGSMWQKQKVETFEGGKNKVLDGSTKTGYYLRKYMNPSVSLDPDKPNKLHHHYVLFRYAEILLNYAEAMNEWKGPDETAEGCPLTARQVLNMIRDCADMKHIDANGTDFTAKVRNERRIELAFEGHRFYDIRRWKIAGLDEVRNIYGVKITKNSTSLSYQKVLLQQMYWDDKMYLFPYPQNEIYMNPDLGQNPGWNNGN